MIYPDEEMFPRGEGDPPPHSLDWLWYRPGTGNGDHLFPAYNAYCRRCDVFRVIKPMEESPHRCWVCGRFVAKPGQWSPHHQNGVVPGRRNSNSRYMEPGLDEELDL